MACRQRRVIIADPEQRVRGHLRQVLTALGYRVVGEVDNGQASLPLARRVAPDVVLMDITPPRLDGFAAACRLTSEGVTPVICMAAHTGPEVVVRAVEAGALGYLLKPVRAEQLGPAIEVAARRFAALRGARRANSALRRSLEDRVAIDRAKHLLMEHHGLGETAAYQQLRRQAMDTRTPMALVAEALLAAVPRDGRFSEPTVPVPHWAGPSA